MERFRIAICILLLFFWVGTSHGQNASVGPLDYADHVFAPDYDYHPWPAGDPLGFVGNALVGDSTSVVYEVASGGPVPLRISSIYIHEDPGSAFTVTHDTITPELYPHERVYFNIHFSPSALGRYDGVFRVVSNDRETPIIDLPIHGFGVDTITPVPVPSAMLLAGSGLLTLAGIRRKRKLKGAGF